MGTKPSLKKRDVAVVGVCNFLLRHFTSETYYFWYCAIMVRGKEVLNLDLEAIQKDED